MGFIWLSALESRWDQGLVSVQEAGHRQLAEW